LDWVDHASGRWCVAGAQKSYNKIKHLRANGFSRVYAKHLLALGSYQKNGEDQRVSGS
jgi:hypothetical protein